MAHDLLKVENLVKIYGGSAQTKALGGVTFALRSGAFVAVLGPSGSGKSTLLRVLGCLERPTSGTVLFDGEELSKTGEGHRARVRNTKIGIVTGPTILLPRLSVARNVELPLVYTRIGLRQRARRVRQELEAVGLHDRQTSRPDRLTPAERVKVVLARAMVTDPTIILADEPTAALDRHSSTEILSVFERLNRMGKTVLITTDQKEFADYAERIIVLKHGKISVDKPVSNRKNAIKVLLDK